MPDERKKKQRTPQERSMDPAAQEMLIRADELGLGTAFSRAEQMAPCPIGADGSCCRLCFMGPCRLVKDGQTGVCGATIETITARNFARAVAAGSAAHSDHGRDLAFTLQAVAKGEAPGYTIRDPVQAQARGRRSSRSRPRAGRCSRSPATWPTCSWRSSASRTASCAWSSAPPRRARRSGASRSCRRAASTARSSRCCTARTWATTRTRTISCTRRCAPPWPTAGAAR